MCDAGAYPAAGKRQEVGGLGKRQSTFASRGNDCLPERMLAELFCAGGDPQHVVARVLARERSDTCQPWRSGGQGAGLVDGHLRGVREMFHRDGRS